MFRIILQIWPAFIPIALLLLWYVYKCRQQKKNSPDADKPKLKDEPWIRVLIVSVAIAIVCLFAIVLTQDGSKGEYVPASTQGGQLLNGHVE